MAGALGRRVPPDWEHADKFPLTSSMAAALAPTPVILGVNWYPAFDNLTRDSRGRWWVRKIRDGEQPRGGHCVCVLPPSMIDNLAWWTFYDQGEEGACVGFGISRGKSLVDRKRYFSRWLWDRAKETDMFFDTNPGDPNGTSVRAGLEILRTRGHIPWRSTDAMRAADRDHTLRFNLTPTFAERISAYRWARNASDVLSAISSDADHVILLNSWGRFYPHFVRMPAATLDRLIDEDGEAGVITDA